MNHEDAARDKVAGRGRAGTRRATRSPRDAAGQRVRHGGRRPAMGAARSPHPADLVIGRKDTTHTLGAGLLTPPKTRPEVSAPRHPQRPAPAGRRGDLRSSVSAGSGDPRRTGVCFGQRGRFFDALRGGTQKIGKSAPARGFPAIDAGPHGRGGRGSGNAPGRPGRRGCGGWRWPPGACSGRGSPAACVARQRGPGSGPPKAFFPDAAAVRKIAKSGSCFSAAPQFSPFSKRASCSW
jgi:hypothetical protein